MKEGWDWGLGNGLFSGGGANLVSKGCFRILPPVSVGIWARLLVSGVAMGLAESDCAYRIMISVIWSPLGCHFGLLVSSVVG